MIEIKETKKCDTRSNGGIPFTQEDVERETLYHIKAVQECAHYLCRKIIVQVHSHDHTKLGEYLPAFTKALQTGFKGKEFKGLDWWDIHKNNERHHLNDRCPNDVNLIDVIEMICDCVSAGMARTGSVYDINIPNEILQKAVKNTKDLLIKNIKVVKEK